MAVFYAALNIRPVRRVDSQVVASSRCSACGHLSATLMRCPGCRLAHYCSERCRNNHTWHATQCDAARRHCCWRDGLDIAGPRVRTALVSDAWARILDFVDTCTFGSARLTCTHLYTASAGVQVSERFNRNLGLKAGISTLFSASQTHNVRQHSNLGFLFECASPRFFERAVPTNASPREKNGRQRRAQKSIRH